jgi:hypothetical protein
MYTRYRPIEGYCCLECDAIYSDRYLITFLRNILKMEAAGLSETLINIVTCRGEYV